MSRRKHTPGPWRLADERQVLGPRGETVAEVTDTAEALEGDDAEADANARLIAAAPDLLAACEEALEDLENEGYEDAGPTYVVTRLKAAVARATGETL